MSFYNRWSGRWEGPVALPPFPTDVPDVWAQAREIPSVTPATSIIDVRVATGEVSYRFPRKKGRRRPAWSYDWSFKGLDRLQEDYLLYEYLYNQKNDCGSDRIAFLRKWARENFFPVYEMELWGIDRDWPAPVIRECLKMVRDAGFWDFNE